MGFSPHHTLAQPAKGWDSHPHYPQRRRCGTFPANQTAHPPPLISNYCGYTIPDVVRRLSDVTINSICGFTKYA
jgi:hypothetical protein